MSSVRAMVGFEKERSCMSNEPSALTEVSSEHHWYSRWGILVISVAWLKCRIGNSTFHRLRWWEKNHCFTIQACFDHSIRILLRAPAVTYHGIKGRGWTIPPQHPLAQPTVGVTPLLQGLVPFSLEDPALPPIQTQFVVLHLTYTHTHWFLLCLSQTKPTETWCRKLK